MAVTYGYSDTGYPYVIARYTCRCGGTETQHGGRRLDVLPRGWQALRDAAGMTEHVCPGCAKRTAGKS